MRTAPRYRRPADVTRLSVGDPKSVHSNDSRTDRSGYARAPHHVSPHTAEGGSSILTTPQVSLNGKEFKTPVDQSRSVPDLKLFMASE
ncbi:unnamed protein product, partial [Iphiclides podalirius]